MECPFGVSFGGRDDVIFNLDDEVAVSDNGARTGVWAKGIYT